MASYMVNENIELVKDYFLKNLSSFSIEKEAFHGPFWYISFVFNEIRVIIKGDIGFGIVLELYGSKYDLWQYDRSVNDAMDTTEKNILYQLSVLKSFFNNTEIIP